MPSRVRGPYILLPLIFLSILMYCNPFPFQFEWEGRLKVDFSAHRSYSGDKYCLGETVGSPFVSIDKTSLLSITTCMGDVISCSSILY